MKIFVRNGKRFNIHAPHTIDGVLHPAGSLVGAGAEEKRIALGITEVDEGLRESSETHFVQEIDEAPYIVNTPKPQEMLDEQNNNKVKAKIAEIERDQHRAIREAVLSGDKTRLQQIDDLIAAERGKMKKTGTSSSGA